MIQKGLAFRLQQSGSVARLDEAAWPCGWILPCRLHPRTTARRKQTFMLFAYPTGVQGNVVSAGVNEFIIPNYKQTWGAIRKIADAPEAVRHLTFKSEEYSAT